MKKKQRLVQSGSSRIEGLGDTVTIQSPGNDIEGSNAKLGDTSQTSSLILIGSGNMVSINTREDIEYETSIRVTKSYRQLLEFSLVGTGGLHEVVQLYIEQQRIHRCKPGPVAMEASYFQHQFSLELVPTVRIYPLLPPTLTNSMDRWILEGEEVELFSVRFSWPSMTAIDVVVKADVIDHRTGKESHLRTEVLNLSRNGETRTGEYYSPRDSRPDLSPYLYKLLTFPGLLGRTGESESELNRNALLEIADIFNCDLGVFETRLQSKWKSDYLFEAKVHPAIAGRLRSLAESLTIWLETNVIAKRKPGRLYRVFIAVLEGIPYIGPAMAELINQARKNRNL